MLSRYQFDPRSISGLAVWLDAQDYARFVFSGSNITSVINKGFKGGSLTGGGTPTYSASAINSKPGVLFNASSDKLSFANASLGSISNLTAFVVALRDTDSGTVETMIGQFNTTGDQRMWRLYVNASDGISQQQSTDGTGGTTSGINAIGTVAAAGSAYIAECSFDDTNDIRKVGLNNNITQGSIASLYAGTADLTIGGRADSTEPFAGKIGEALLYNTLLSENSKSKVRRYLSAKWGIPL